MRLLVCKVIILLVIEQRNYFMVYTFANYDFEDFLNVVKHLDQEDIMHVVSEKQEKLAKLSVRSKKEGASDLAEKINAFLFWLKTGKKPSKLSFPDFIKIKPLAESLIRKGQLKPEALKSFKG
jgi:hypothetical protein